MLSEHREEAEARELWQTLTGSRAVTRWEEACSHCYLAFRSGDVDQEVPSYYRMETHWCGVGAGMIQYLSRPLPSTPHDNQRMMTLSPGE